MHRRHPRHFARAFLTLTYRPGVDWQPRHITECLKRMRHWVERRGVRFRYLWVAEQRISCWRLTALTSLRPSVFDPERSSKGNLYTCRFGGTKAN
jgi:hypothetical protein